MLKKTGIKEFCPLPNWCQPTKMRINIKKLDMEGEGEYNEGEMDKARHIRRNSIEREESI